MAAAGRAAGAGSLVALCGGVPAGAEPAPPRSRPQPASHSHNPLSTADIDGARPAKLIREPRGPSPTQAPPDPSMVPRRYTHERRRGPADLHLSAPADIPGATAGSGGGAPRPRARPLNPLAPDYPWTFEERQEPAPPPKFVRDTLDVSDIQGARAEAAGAHPARGPPSTMDAGDIEGAKPGWRPKQLFSQPRDPLQVSDISGASSLAERGAHSPGQRRRLLLGLPPAGLPSSAPCTSRQQGAGAAAALPLPQSARCEQQAVPEFGVAYTVDWQKRRAAAKLREGEAARQARQAADAAIAAAAAKAAAAAAAAAGSGARAEQPAAGSVGGGSSGGLAGVLKSLRAVDREGCGRVQGRDFAAALQRGGLGLGPVDVAGLVAGVQDGLGAVDYRTVASKLWGKLQLGQAAAAGGSSGGAGSPCTRAAAPAAPAAQPSLHLPQFVRARQRRLQTNVALALGQQPEALAREAAEVAALPGFLPWKQAEAAQGKRTAYDRPAEFGGAGAGANKFCFADGDPRAAQAAQQWRASHEVDSICAIWRAPPKPREQPQHRRGGSAPLLPSAAAPQGHATHAGQRAVGSAPSTAGPRPLRAASAGVRGPVVPAFRQDAGGAPLAAERAARAAGSHDAALLHSLS